MSKIQRRPSPKRLRVKNIRARASSSGSETIGERILREDAEYNRPTSADISRRSPPDEAETDLMTLREVAHWLRVAPSTVYRMVQRHQIPAFRFGRNFRFKRSEIEAGMAREALNHSETDRRYKRNKKPVSTETGAAKMAQDYDAWISG